MIQDADQSQYLTTSSVIQGLHFHKFSWYASVTCKIRIWIIDQRSGLVQKCNRLVLGPRSGSNQSILSRYGLKLARRQFSLTHTYQTKKITEKLKQNYEQSWVHEGNLVGGWRSIMRRICAKNFVEISCAQRDPNWEPATRILDSRSGSVFKCNQYIFFIMYGNRHTV